MVTPFDKAGDIDRQGVGDLVHHLCSHGVDGVFVGGTTGEGPLLSQEERKRLAEFCVDAADGYAKVIVHTGCISTRDSIDLACHAESIGANAIAAITPYFFTFGDDEIAKHYLTLAGAVPELPLLLYCFPGNAKHDISAEAFAALRARAPNIVGIKYSGSSFGRIQEYIDAAGPDGYVHTGDDGLMLAALLAGASGPVSGTAGPFPELFRSLYDAVATHSLAEAQRLQKVIRKLVPALAYGQPAVLKAALELRGLRVGLPRAPFDTLSASEMVQLEARLQELGLL